MTDPLNLSGEAREFVPCPLCKQYSHSIGEDQLAAAFMHFQSMYAHPVRGHPMGHNFDGQTRDAAQVLMAAATSPDRRVRADLCAKVEADAVSALRYIEQRYGRLEGVGWDRVFDAHDKLFADAEALSTLESPMEGMSDGGD